MEIHLLAERGPAVNLNVTALGQVFTSPAVVSQMLALRRNRGRTLEPSCGNGAFSKQIRGCVAIEFDGRVAPKGAQVMDFFDYPASVGSPGTELEFAL